MTPIKSHNVKVNSLIKQGENDGVRQDSITLRPCSKTLQKG